jgi:bifunctional DNase/RNase
MTDLPRNMLAELDARVTRVAMSDLRDSTFFARAVTKMKREVAALWDIVQSFPVAMASMDWSQRLNAWSMRSRSCVAQ